jgi:hypothetical protein
MPGAEQVISAVIGWLAIDDIIQFCEVLLVHSPRQAQLCQRAILAADLDLLDIQLLSLPGQSVNLRAHTWHACNVTAGCTRTVPSRHLRHNSMCKKDLVNN